MLSYCQIESTTFWLLFIFFLLLYFWLSIQVFQNSCCLVTRQVGASLLSTGGLVLNFIDDHGSMAFGFTSMFYLLSFFCLKKSTIKIFMSRKAILSKMTAHCWLPCRTDVCKSKRFNSRNSCFDNKYVPFHPPPPLLIMDDFWLLSVGRKCDACDTDVSMFMFDVAVVNCC